MPLPWQCAEAHRLMQTHRTPGHIEGRRALWATVGTWCAVTAACAVEISPPHGATRLTWEVADFAGACVASRALTLPAGGSKAYPATLGYPVFLTDGSFIVIDSRVSRFYRIDSLGHSMLVFGRLGDGPGEFRLPSDAVMMDDSLLAVVDPAQQRVTVLDLAGDEVSAFRTPGFSARRIVALPRQRLALTGLHSVEGQLRMLAIFTALGELEGSAVPAPGVLARYTPRIDDVLVAATSNGTVLMSSIALPTLYVVRDRTVQEITFAPPGPVWRQLEPLVGPPRTIGEARAWIQGASFLSSFGLANDSVLVVGWSTPSGPSEDTGEQEGYVAAINWQKGVARVFTAPPGRLLKVLGVRWSFVTEVREDANVVQWYQCSEALERL